MTSRDYHDYVFQNGRLLGDFDGMYRKSTAVPWGQDTASRRWYTQVGFTMVRECGPYGWVLEIGCGLGYIASQIRGQQTAGIEAFDVSPTAITEASRLHSGIGFFVDDIAADSFRPRRPYDLVVACDLFWYVFPKLETVVRNIETCVKPGGHLYIRQSFPPLDREFVGKERIADPDELIALFPAFTPIHSARLVNHQMDDGPILHLMSRSRSS